MDPQSHIQQLLTVEVVRGWCRGQAETNPRFRYDEAQSGGSSSVRFSVQREGGFRPVACEVQVGDGGQASLVRLDTNESTAVSQDFVGQHTLEDTLDKVLASLAGEAPDCERGSGQPQHQPDTFVEGTSTTMTLDRYERSRSARQTCLAAHGTSCAICGFDFGKTYGPAFAGIIQVHHIVPVSERGGLYEVDPVRDLIPVCPNCHVALHSKPGGTYTPDELRSILARHQKP